MPHILSKLGKLLRVPPTNHDEVGRDSSTALDSATAIGDSGQFKTTRDLAGLALKPRQAPPDPGRKLGQLGLIPRDLKD